MNIKIYYTITQEWLEPISIHFGTGNCIWMVKACEIGANLLEGDGWFEFMGENLKHISISGDINYNIELMPTEPTEQTEQQNIF